MESRIRESRAKVRSYYDTVADFIELELAGRKDGPYWESRARELDAPRILELGTGTGRVTRFLWPEARRLVGVDLSQEMLERARAELGHRPHVHLVLADMRDLPFMGTFDLVVAANDPFAHLPTDRERDRVLENVAALLRPGGLFVTDAHWLRPEARRRAQGPEGWSRTRPLGDPDEELGVHQRVKLDPETSRGEVRFEYLRKGRRVGTASFRPRLWTVEEVYERLPRLGFRIRRLLGDFHEAPWDPETARHLVVEAVREEEER